jgi:hypothetical protein
MNRHVLAETKVTPGPLFKLTGGIRHVQTTTPIADRQAVGKDVLAKPDRHLGIERLHEPVAKDISGNNVRVSRTKDQIAVGMDPGPVKRHKAALVSKRVEIV